MPFQSLPIECISHIFESFKDESLYSCLQVNRFWCRNIIPILYKAPFTIIKKQRGNKGQRSKIISTYLSCLKNEEKIYLMNNSEIELSLNTFTLFDYPIFLEEFCNASLEEKISHWIMIQNISTKQQQLVQIISNMLYTLLISKSENLDYLNIISMNETNNFDIPDIHTFIAYVPGLRNISRFDFKLGESELQSSNITKLINIIPSICNNIQIINFDSSNDDQDNESSMTKSLCRIIESQKNLEKLYLKFKGRDLINIMLALELQSNLTYLYFKKLRLNEDAINSLTNCKALKFLGFEACRIKSKDHCKYFANNVQFQLETLYLVENLNRHIIPEIKCLIIQSAGQSLQKLIIDEIDSNISTIILKYCSNIIELFLMASEYKSTDFYNLLIKLRHLRKLSLWFTNEYIMKSLGNYLPDSLNHLNFINLCCMPYVFDNFLKECNVPIESLEIFRFVIGSNDHLKSIHEYVKNHYHHLKVIYLGINSDTIKDELIGIKDFVDVKFISKDYKWIPGKFN